MTRHLWFLALCVPGLLAAQAPTVVSTEWLAAHLKDPSVVVLQVGTRDSSFRTQHIPGSRYVAYFAIAPEVAGLHNELPPGDSLRSYFESVGMSDGSQVVLVGRPLDVTRAFYTLDYFGFPRVALLDGGVTKWQREGRAVETSITPSARGHLTARTPRHEIVVQTAFVSEHLGKPGYTLFDTRTDEEYQGSAPNAKATDGHIPGARRVNWHDYFTSETDFQLADRQTLSRIWSETLRSSTDTVIAYCAIGYRASATYFVSRLLGTPAKVYDGSAEAWGNENKPVVKGPTP
jgi:thiosulfate/3-mercaptopyruvate sulfurtransferase